MASEITNYQCPACTAPLRFDGESGKLVCDFCGSSFPVAEIEARYAQQNQAAAAEFGKPEAAPAGSEENGDLRAYVCPSCGAELICEKTTAATECPYCGNPTVVPGQLSGGLEPEFVLPFKVTKEEAIAALHRHYGKRNFYLPRQFRADNHIQKVQGVYVPFWLFDASMEAQASFDASDSVTHREGDYQVTRTMHYDVRREGHARFDRIPVDGSRKLPDNYMDALEPFPMDQLKPFSTAYLPGFLADRFDVSAEDAEPRMESRCRESMEFLLRQDVNHTIVTSRDFSGRITEKTAHYALMPVWMLTTRWKEKRFLFAMNGQTGKFVGELPTDNVLFWRNLGVLALILTMVLRFSGITQAILSLFG